jgi:hypothetical protein
MSEVTFISAVNDAPLAFFPVYQPPKLYPEMLGGVGNESIVVAGVVTVLLVGLGITVVLSVSLNWLLKPTV